MSSILTDQQRPRGGGFAGSQLMSTYVHCTVHRSPNKLWRSNPIVFNQWLLYLTCRQSSCSDTSNAATVDVTTGRVSLKAQSTYIYRAPQCMSPRRNWDSPTPLPQASVPSPPDQRVGGHTRLHLRGWGSSNSDAGEKAQHSAYSVA